MMFRLLAAVFNSWSDRDRDDEYGSDPLAIEDTDDCWNPAT
jgi:hypothetical protein